MFLKYNIGDIIDNQNYTENKKAQQDFTEEFRLLSKELSPQIAKFITDNHITLKPSLFFFASMIRELLENLEDDKEKDDMFKVLMLFMSGDKYGEI